MPIVRYWIYAQVWFFCVCIITCVALVVLDQNRQRKKERLRDIRERKKELGVFLEREGEKKKED